jgi:hypothetical protein
VVAGALALLINRLVINPLRSAASENLNRLGAGLGEVSEHLTRMVGR